VKTPPSASADLNPRPLERTQSKWNSAWPTSGSQGGPWWRVSPAWHF